MRMRTNLKAIMASCESKRSSAYSDDLRWRIIWQQEALNLKYSDIAVNLFVSESTVRRIVQRFETSGDVSKNKYPSAAAFRKITEPAGLYPKFHGTDGIPKIPMDIRWQCWTSLGYIHV